MFSELSIEKEGEEKKILDLKLLEILPVPFLFSLEFATPSDQKKISKKIKKLHQNGELSREQLWLGSYFKKEILYPYIPKLLLRYINRELGWGVFANRDFKKGEFVAEYTGKVRKRKRQDAKNAYCFEYPLSSQEFTPFLIDAENEGGIARYINHSNQPNLNSSLATVEFLSHIVLTTNRHISKGEQLCYDYGPDYWAKRNTPEKI